MHPSVSSANSLKKPFQNHVLSCVSAAFSRTKGERRARMQYIQTDTSPAIGRQPSRAGEEDGKEAVVFLFSSCLLNGMSGCYIPGKWRLSMKVVVAKFAGFCMGVKRAMNKARGIPHSPDQPIYTDGPLIHNSAITAQLRREGIVITDRPEKVSGVLIIKAHGVSPERRKYLRSLNLKLVDGTCPDVAKIQGAIMKHVARGAHVLIFGDKGHAEVVGLLGCCGSRGGLVENVADVRKLAGIAGPVCLVSQSTQIPAEYRKIGNAVRKRFPGAEVIDTICRSTKSRQDELSWIARKTDAIVVVGDSRSANTCRLFKLASNPGPAFLVQKASQIKPCAFRRFKTVGIVAGASTPSFIIDKVRLRLERVGKPK